MLKPHLFLCVVLCCVLCFVLCCVVLSCVVLSCVVLCCLVLCEVCCVVVGVCRWGVQDFRGCVQDLARGFTRQPESPNVHISGSRPSKTPPKFNERTPEREKKERKLGREREKKREILGLPPFWAPPFGAPLFLGLGPHPERPPPFGASQFGALA